MKRFLSVLLLIALVVSAAACGTPEPVDSDPNGDPLDIPSDPNAPMASPTAGVPTAGQQTGPEPSIEVAQPGESANPDESAAPVSTATPPPPSTEENPEVTIKPEATPDPKNTPIAEAKMPTKLSDAKKINKDTIGWIKVPNTKIDLPIMYRMDPKWYYNDHDFFKQPSTSGCIYSYYDKLTRNVILSGHNMRKSKTMFHELHTLQNNKNDLKTEKNRIFKIDLFGYTEWEVWALYETKDSEPKDTLKNNIKPLGNDTDVVKKWIDGQKKRSEIDLGVDVSSGDVLMTIITCGDNYDHATAQSRLYFFLKARQPAAS